MSFGILNREFFARPTLEVAPALVGAVLHVEAADGTCSGRIVEVEAYRGRDDPASHAGRGKTPRSAIMFGAAGVAYVYLVYGMHHCLNFVVEADGKPGAVLIRALEPLAGRDLMARRRGLESAICRDREIAAGPGRLCAACGIDLEWNGVPLHRRKASAAPGRIWVERDPELPPNVAATPRIGIRRAAERPWRWVDPGSSCLSA